MLPHFLESRLTDGGEVVSLTRWLSITSPGTFLVLISASQGNSPVPIQLKLGGPENRSGHWRIGKNILLLLEVERRRLIRSSPLYRLIYPGRFTNPLAYWLGNWVESRAGPNPVVTKGKFLSVSRIDWRKGMKVARPTFGHPCSMQFLWRRH
jgi:hypothetical protein